METPLVYYSLVYNLGKTRPRIQKKKIQVGGLPFSTYAPKGKGGIKPPIHFPCVLHVKTLGGGPNSM